MNDETIKTIAWAIVLLAAIREIGAYSTLHLLTTGKALFQRKREPDEDAPRLYAAR